MFKITLCLSLMGFVFTKATVVTFIDPCKVGDDDCLMKSAVKAFPHLVAGIPALGIPSADPLVLDNDINGDSGDLKLEFKNMVVHGIAKCQINKITRPDYLKASLQLECPVVAKGQYTAGGKLFVVPVVGDGDCEITTEKIKFDIDFTLQKEKHDDGKEYYKIGSYDYKYVPVEKIHMKYHNLFNGDKEKAAPVEKILDENWETLVKELGKPFVDDVVAKCVHCIDTLFKAMPVSEVDKN